ncbi:50S ribosomal protein L35 [Candidatus Uhrbacteria bacterium CG10_big_fil_rev_8_21_14_0_10_48_11]|uniref:50S ribosomal protein L35 n=1 Tax=Candidatus Uhrbacteria bacterium CG10_big_fil_rev_8_21_14_0_10_48_11 TaxID=1975037 RepID=A0A2M8LFH1_9BACT|nr:MAG: 50S ribosomal protein L35 [Candidatus Uhrbacteria bacterium CG10_big_fil_rev_8_21_14_0_10_48_11]
MKLKTRKSLAKRVHVTGGKTQSRWGSGGKLLRKHAGQSHFNAREESNVTQKKRRSGTVHKTISKNVRQLLPYS